MALDNFKDMGGSKSGKAPAPEATKDIASATYFDDAKSLSDFVLVRRSKNVDVKTPSTAVNGTNTGMSVPGQVLQKPLLQRTGINMRTRVKLNPVTTKLVIPGGGNSAAATAFTTVTAVDPTQSPEFTNFASLYDECKVLGGEVHFRAYSNGGTGAGPLVELIIAYDPSNSGVYASVDGALVASQNSGIKIATVNVHQASENLAAIGSPVPVNSSGFWSFKFKCPSQPTHIATATAADQEICTGNWIDTNTVLTPKFGFLKPYVGSSGGSGVMALDAHIVLDVAFRSRS